MGRVIAICSRGVTEVNVITINPVVVNTHTIYLKPYLVNIYVKVIKRAWALPASACQLEAFDPPGTSCSLPLKCRSYVIITLHLHKKKNPTLRPQWDVASPSGPTDKQFVILLTFWFSLLEDALCLVKKHLNCLSELCVTHTDAAAAKSAHFPLFSVYSVQASLLISHRIFASCFLVLPFGCLVVWKPLLRAKVRDIQTNIAIPIKTMLSVL